MITFTILMILWGVISYIRINSASNNIRESWHLANGTFLDAIGFVCGIIFLLLTTVYLFIVYLP